MKTKEKQEQPIAPKDLPAAASTYDKSLVDKSMKAGMKVEYANAYVLKGKALHPFTTDSETAAKIAEEKQSLEKKFKSETELAELVLNNGKTLFGEKTILIDCLKKNNVEFSGGFVPDGLLFDLRESEKPRFYFIEVMLSKENLAKLFLRITRLFSFFRTKENITQFTATLSDAIRKNIGWRNKLKPAFGDKGTHEFLQELFTRQPAILLILDAPFQELTGFRETYTETWGRYVKPILIRKLVINKDTIITMVPTFVELNSKKNGKAEKVKSTEEDHLENVSETVKEIFLEIKSELLKENAEIEFRVKRFYISLRKKRNLAFFQLGKKKLSIVIANPEKDTRKQIKHHEVRTLADSVKRFWNGNDDCFTVVIESKEHLEEVTSLLKKMVAGGNQEENKVCDDVPADLSVRSATKAEVPQEGTKAGKIKSQAKPKSKNGKKR